MKDGNRPRNNKIIRSSAWRRSREYVAVDLLLECTGRVEAMAILTHFRCGYYIVARDVGRPVPTNTQGLGAEIDVAHFGSRFVSAYTAKIRHQSRPVEPDSIRK